MLYGTLIVYKHIGSNLIQANLDTVYACQDIKDDVKMGVRSTAILFGVWIRPLLVLCGLMFVTMLTIAGHLNSQGPAYFIVSIGGTVIHLLWQYTTVDLGMPKSCWSKSFFLQKFRPSLSHNKLTRKFSSQRPTWMDRVGRIDDRLSS
jgi:4-hydroxybenzoate polyprenyltransferase